MTTSTTTAGVSLRLKHSIDNDGEYGAFTAVSVDILKNGSKIGLIEATVVNRQNIPDGSFLSACDGHSQSLQYVGLSVYESRYGRTKLQSLVEYDDPEFYTMYIDTFHIDDEYKTNNNSDVATNALHQFLHHSFIKGDLPYGCWKVSSAVYILDPLESMSKEEVEAHKAKMETRYGYASMIGDTPPETDDDRRAKVVEKQRLDALAHKDAIPFLRNGFFQDEAIAKQGEDRIIVASYGHWNASRPPLTDAQAEAVQFYVPPPKPPVPMGKDADILQAVISTSSKYGYAGTPMTQSEMSAFRNKLNTFVNAGGSLSRSFTIHAACANNAKPILDLLLQLDPTLVNALDSESSTPLMIAAVNAAGRSTISGIPETNVIDTLLAAGADKNIQDSMGFTAYGHFKRQSAEYEESSLAMMGRSATSTSRGVHPTHVAVERKLLPSLGPTTADRTGGKGQESGFVDYSEEDREDDAMSDDYQEEKSYADY